MAIEQEIMGMNEWLWQKSATTAASLKLVYGATGFDVSSNRTAIKTATQTNLGSTGAAGGFKNHTFKATFLDFNVGAGDMASYYSKADFLTAYNTNTKVTLAWGAAPATGVCAVSTVLETGTFVITSVSRSKKVDGQSTYDVGFEVDGDITTYTTT